MPDSRPAHLRASRDEFRWEDVTLLPYKEGRSAPFSAISRQTLFAEPDLGCELRYFEMQPGGHSSLERHEHVHAVMILRGRGECLVGDDVRPVKPLDLVTIPAWTWHQFRATAGEAFGFLCMVNQARDKPQLPGEDELAMMKRNPIVAAFLAFGPGGPDRSSDA